MLFANACTPPTPTITVAPSHGVHLFEVPNYSHHRDLGVGSFIRSATFDIGSCAWSIRFYPNGARNEGCITVALELMTRNATVTVSCDLRLVVQATTTTTEVARYSAMEAGTAAFDTRCVDRFVQLSCTYQFITKSELEASTYLRDDSVVMECTLRVIRGTRPSPAEPEINVPPSDMADHLGRLLMEGDGTDVTFDIQGKTFPAHRMLLAARSPVFKVELHGPMKFICIYSSTQQRLQFLNDINCCATLLTLATILAACSIALTVRISPLPSAVGPRRPLAGLQSAAPQLDGSSDQVGSSSQLLQSSSSATIVLLQNLFAAEDMYHMERLKLVCTHKLWKHLSTDTIAAMQRFAELHNSPKLKNACIDFFHVEKNFKQTSTSSPRIKCCPRADNEVFRGEYH
ncbi:hypothetical protein EJB05_09089, partial [Eragrostis curvula]